jgi:hypothetical protein
VHRHKGRRAGRHLAREGGVDPEDDREQVEHHEVDEGELAERVGGLEQPPARARRQAARRRPEAEEEEREAQVRPDARGEADDGEDEVDARLVEASGRAWVSVRAWVKARVRVRVGVGVEGGGWG